MRRKLVELAGLGEFLAAQIASHPLLLDELLDESSGGLPPPGLYQRVLREMERPLITLSLAATRGNQIRAAHLLGLNRNTLRKKIRDLGLEVVRGLRPD